VTCQVGFGDHAGGLIALGHRQAADLVLPSAGLSVRVLLCLRQGLPGSARQTNGESGRGTWRHGIAMTAYA